MARRRSGTARSVRCARRRRTPARARLPRGRRPLARRRLGSRRGSRPPGRRRSADRGRSAGSAQVAPVVLAGLGADRVDGLGRGKHGHLGPRRHARPLLGVEDDGLGDDAPLVLVDDVHLQAVGTVDANGPVEGRARLLRERELLAEGDCRPAHPLVDQGERGAAVHVGRGAGELGAQGEVGEHECAVAVVRERHLHPARVRRLADEAVGPKAPARVLEPLDAHLPRLRPRRGAHLRLTSQRSFSAFSNAASPASCPTEVPSVGYTCWYCDSSLSFTPSSIARASSWIISPAAGARICAPTILLLSVMITIRPSVATSARARSLWSRSICHTWMWSPCFSRASASVRPLWASSGSVNVHHGTAATTLPFPGKNMSRTARTPSYAAEWVKRYRPATSPQA